MWLAANRRMQEFAYSDSKVTTHGTTMMSSAPESVKQAFAIYA